MKYKDYYAILGVEKTATADQIKAAYRKLARKYHPDVSKEKDAEAKFKEVAEAYQTLKDPEKRTAYDQLGSYQPGQDFRPPPEWQQHFGEEQFSFDDVDLADLFEAFRGGRASGARRGKPRPLRGQDYEVVAHITLDQAYHGAEVNLELSVPEYDERGLVHRVARSFKARIPKGATDGQRLRVPGKGGKGFHGGRDGDLYLDIALEPHPLFRVSGHDLYIDLPLAPWEAVLGTTVELPTPGAPVLLKVPPGTHAGQHLRLSKRGLPKPGGGEGDLFAIAQIVVPTVIGDAERELYRQLAERSAFNPRAHYAQELSDASRTH
ncbi:MAG TPA: DnaJ C-terminal domain-containing protein [Casimicrobiaceae bacterium]|nr:DnaJ C-terminal domain-containing protein [Casimicrobiaceae bacterium]